MHVIRNTEEIRKFIGEKKTAVALGAFDGLHIGHYKVCLLYTSDAADE